MVLRKNLHRERARTRRSFSLITKGRGCSTVCDGSSSSSCFASCMDEISSTKSFLKSETRCPPWLSRATDAASASCELHLLDRRCVGDGSAGEGWPSSSDEYW
eukprot:scaffold1792_cov124-Isochrysis_galbana.AAC.6